MKNSKIDYSNKDVRHELIINHYEHPKNKIDEKKFDIKKYSKSSQDSPSCIDNITAYMLIKNNKVVDVKFSGVGCAIAISSTDLMANQLINKTVSEAKKIISNYLDMTLGKPIKCDLGTLIVFDNVYKQANRIKCAQVGIKAISNAIDK